MIIFDEASPVDPSVWDLTERQIHERDPCPPESRCAICWPERPKPRYEDYAREAQAYERGGFGGAFRSPTGSLED